MLTLSGLALAGLSLAGLAFAGGPSTGRHHFVVEDRADGSVLRRGLTGEAGTAFANLILPPNRDVRIRVLRVRDFAVGRVELRTPGVGQVTAVPEISLAPSSSPDSDGDTLPDEGESIVGTNPAIADTDMDGLSDAAELRTGSNPITPDQSPAGLVAVIDTPGSARDVEAGDNLVVVADGPSGITVFNVYGGMRPRVVARLDTPGMASRVACAGARVLVADGFGGLVIADLSDPPAARIERTIGLAVLGARPLGVLAVGELGYVGLEDGSLIVIDLQTGIEVARATVASGEPVQDLAVAGETLFALTDGTLRAGPIDPAGLSFADSVAVPAGARRLAVVGEVAYVAARSGFHSFNVSDTANMAALQSSNSLLDRCLDIAVDGAGGLIAVGRRTSGGDFDLRGFDVSDPALNDVTTGDIATPGEATAVTIFNGLTYVADGSRGLTVIRTRAADTAGQAPTISLATVSGQASAEEGSVLAVRASVADDVLVRNVEFFVEGERVSTDGHAPFELQLPVPLRSSRTTLSISARVSDTGGNTTAAAPLTVIIGADATAPAVTSFKPESGVVNRFEAASAIFSEALAPSTIVPASVSLIEAGPDLTLNTADDQTLAVAGLSYSGVDRTLRLTFGPGLAVGLYRLSLTTAFTDRAGNALAAPVERTIRLLKLGGADGDGDGVPDAVEELLGLDPQVADSDGDGTADGLEDADADGLTLLAELAIGLDPGVMDTNGNGISDGDEDADRDGLTNAMEVSLGTDPLEQDSDGDGVADLDEQQAGFDPADPASTPPVSVRGPAVSVANLANGAGAGAVSVRGRPISVANLANGAGAGAVTVRGTPVSVANVSGGAGEPTITISAPRVSFSNRNRSGQRRNPVSPVVSVKNN